MADRARNLLGVDLRQYCNPQQAVIRRGEWPRADSGLVSVRSRTGSCGFALCIFGHEQRPGWKLCICCTAFHSMCRVERRYAASETYVGARRQVERNRTRFVFVRS
jgi:hypothetical protein